MLSVSAMMKLLLLCFLVLVVGVSGIDPDPPNTCASIPTCTTTSVITTSVSEMTTPAASVPTGMTTSVSSSASAVNPAPGKYNIICPFQYLSDPLTVWDSVLFCTSL